MNAKLTTRTIEQLELGLKRYEVRDTELAGFLLRVSPSGAMAYFCDLRRPDGRRTRIKLGDVQVLSPAQARDEALKILGDLARGVDPVTARQSALQDTLEIFIAKHYKPWVEAHRKTGKETVSRTLKRFSELKATRLTDITAWKIEKWRSSRLKEGIKTTTVNRNVTMLKSILQKAVEWEMIEQNPLARVKPLRTDQSAKVRFLDRDEEKRLRNALDQRQETMREERDRYNEWRTQRHQTSFPDLRDVPFTDHLKPMVLISINTGLRRGELFSLKWENVDLSHRTLTVAGDLAKSGKTRHIPLNREAFETLAAWREQALLDRELVFPNSEGGQFDNVQSSWEALLTKAHVTKFRWHDMRHHFASRLVMAGVDLNTVRELLGHGDLKMTLRYAHLALEVKADAVERLNRVSPYPGKLELRSSGSVGLVWKLEARDE